LKHLVARALELSKKTVEELHTASIPATTNYSKCFSLEVTLQHTSVCVGAFASSSDKQKMGYTKRMEKVLKSINALYMSWLTDAHLPVLLLLLLLF